MPNLVDVELDFFHDIAPNYAKATITTKESKYIGKDVTFELICESDVKDSRAVNDSKVIFSKKIRLESVPVTFDIPLNQKSCYSYAGHMLNIKITSRIRIKRTMMFDKKINEHHHVARQKKKPQTKTSAVKMIDPKDHFNLFRNLNAIPPHNRLFVLGLLLVGLVIIAVNTIIGIHDQMSPDSMTWLYSHYNSEGEGESPFVNSLFGSGAAGAGVWYMIKRQLRKYIKISLHKQPPLIEPLRTYRLTDFIAGKPYCDIQNATLRFVAANIEKGQYRRGSGTDERTVSFEEPTRAIILYETFIPHLPRGRKFVNILPNETFTCDAMFDHLYPPQKISSTHGLNLQWEIQLLHDDFVDQELIGKHQTYNKNDFWTIIDVNEEKAA